LQVPVVSMVVQLSRPDVQSMKAFCVQTTAIQCYTLTPNQMFGPISKPTTNSTTNMSIATTSEPVSIPTKTVTIAATIEVDMVAEEEIDFTNTAATTFSTATPASASTSTTLASTSAPTPSTPSTPLMISTTTQETKRPSPQLLSPVELLKSTLL